jgi:hypothetical protein
MHKSTTLTISMLNLNNSFDGLMLYGIERVSGNAGMKSGMKTEEKLDSVRRGYLFLERKAL